MQKLQVHIDFTRKHGIIIMDKVGKPLGLVF